MPNVYYSSKHRLPIAIAGAISGSDTLGTQQQEDVTTPGSSTVASMKVIRSGAIPPSTVPTGTPTGPQPSGRRYYRSDGMTLFAQHDQYGAHVFDESGNYSNEWVRQLIAGTSITLHDDGGIVTVNADVPESGELRGPGSPVGVVTPTEIGVQYVDEDSGVQWTSTGVADTDWVQVGDQGETCDNGGFLGAHAEGADTQVFGLYGHAEGFTTEAGAYSHAEGWTTQASGEGAHAEGYMTSASGKGAHAEGENTVANAEAAHAEGNGSHAAGPASHAEGYSQALGDGSHAEGISQAYSRGQTAHSGGMITDPGDSQWSRCTQGIETVGAMSKLFPAGGALVTFFDGSSEVFNRTMLVKLTVVARRVDTPGTDSAWELEGVLRGDPSGFYSWIGGTPTFTVVAQDAGASGWLAELLPPSANLLQVSATGEADNTIRWTAVAELYEVQG